MMLKTLLKKKNKYIINYNTTITEAINLTQYKSSLDQGFDESLIKSVAAIAKMKGRFVDEEEAYDTNKPIRLVTNLRNELKLELEKQLARNLKKIIKDKMGISKITIKFSDELDDEGTSGQAEDSVVTMAGSYTKRIATSVIQLLNTYCRETYPQGLLVNGLFRALEMTGKKTDTFLKIGIAPVKKIINGFMVTFIHELVHIIQQQREYKKHKDTSYTSYLGTKAFHNVTDETSDEFNRLYYASPQEIGAFAHTFATRLIIKMGIDRITDPNKLPKVTEEAIKAEIKNRVGEMYQNPSSKVEYGIFKRYLKLVYLEFAYYIESRRKALSPVK